MKRSCPSCGAQTEAAAHTPGQTYRCRKCGSTGLTPEPGTLPSREAASPSVFKGPSDFGSRYEVVGEINRGGMGIVLDAKDHAVRREVAIKVIRTDIKVTEEAVARFVEEAQVQGQLAHPNICPVYDLGTDVQGRRFFAMKKVKGRSLAEVLETLKTKKTSRAKPEHSLTRLLENFVKACDAIAFAHSKGVIHRDLKPDNIMIGEFGEVLVMVWGLARIKGRKVLAAQDLVASDRQDENALRSMSGKVMGTPTYMPPEQARGQVEKIDERSDIYALGGILYSLLTLEPPVEAETKLEALYKAREAIIEPPSKRAPDRKIPGDLAAAAMKALAKDQESRYASVVEFKNDITAYLEGRTLKAVEYTFAQISGKWFRRNRIFAGTAGVALLLLSVSAAFYVINLNVARRTAERAAEREKIEAERAREAEASTRKERDRATAAEKEAKEHAHTAELQAEIAVKERRNAEVRLAEGLLSEGDALWQAKSWHLAKERYRESFDAFKKAGLDTLKSDLALLNAYRLSPPELITIKGHQGWINAVEILSDGRTAISVGNGIVRTWDVLTGRQLSMFEYKSDATYSGFAIAADPRLLLTTRADGLCDMWDLASGKVLRTIAMHSGRVSAIAVGRDGRAAISGGSDGTVRVWNVSTGQEIAAFGHGHTILSVALSVDGKLAASSNNFGTVKVYDITTGKELHFLKPDVRNTEDVSFTRDSKGLLTAGGYGKVHLWNCSDWSKVRSYSGHSSGVRTLRILPDGKRFLSCGEDRTAILWDLDTEEPKLVFTGHSNVILGLAYSPEGDLALTGCRDETMKLWSLAPHGEVRSIPGGSAVISPDGRFVHSTDGLWDLASGCLLRPYTLPIGRDSVSFSPDLHCAAIGQVNQTTIWDLTTNSAYKTLKGHSGTVRAAVYSPDGGTILTVGQDKMLKLWNLDTQTPVWSVEAASSTGIAFSPKGDLILLGTASGNPGLSLWNADNGTKVHGFEESGFVWKVTFSRDGSKALSAGYNADLILWDIPTRKAIRKFIGHGSSIWCVAFSPDGRLALSGGDDQTFRLWDVESGSLLRTIYGTWAILHVGFSPDGRTLISSIGQAHLWDLGRMESLRTKRDELAPALEELRRNPSSPAALNILGRWYAFRGVPRVAVDFLEQARSAGFAVRSLDLARLYWQGRKTAQARKEFERALAQKEDDPEYLRRCLDSLSEEKHK